MLLPTRTLREVHALLEAVLDYSLAVFTRKASLHVGRGIVVFRTDNVAACTSGQRVTLRHVHVAKLI